MKIINIAIILTEKISVSAALSIFDIFDFINDVSLTCHTDIDFLSTTKNIDNSIRLNTSCIEKNNKEYHFIIVPPLKKFNSSIPKDEKLVQWLQNRHQTTNSIICSSCASSYFLAYAGCLSNKNATTHWELEEDFQNKFPEINLQIHKLIIDEGNIITSGGGYSYVDMIFYIINKFISHDIAYTIAKKLIVDMGRISQAYFKTLPIQIKNNDQDIEKLLNWVEEQPYEVLTVQKMAQFLSISSRTFIRKFKKSTGLKPLEYIQNLKVEKAKLLLVNENLTFSEITNKLGYSNSSSFRKLFKKLTHLTPQQYRDKFINLSN